ncbi:MAG: DUF2313 domain-containing protein [Candidimonas sp.]|nr:MAG: DUF2313 domain-containing protein [Candidimonas sp.]TAM23772.1 MAG: DUF2313 domain-containing protein [Candidimonas sp.]
MFSADDFKTALFRLLPRGRAWPRDPGSVQGSVLSAFAQGFADHSDRSFNLLKDAFPPTTYELLPEWESTLGLPDPCAGPLPTIQQRVAQVVARFTYTGGQSAAYYESVASNLGYLITITQFAPSRFGRTFGKSFGGQDWAYAWQVNAPTFTTNAFRFGAGSFGEPFAAWNNNVLSCELQAIAPAHTILNFKFSE